MNLKTYFVLLFCFGAARASVQCYSCRYTQNSGCDLKIDRGRISTTTTCNSDCYTEITRNSDGSVYEVVRGCSASPVCSDISYSVTDSAYIVSCCSGDRCNDDVSLKVFECMQCSDEDGSRSTCPRNGFWESEHKSIATVYCSRFCEKEIRTTEDSTTVTRSCVSSCETSSYSAFGITTETFCCNNQDACNAGNRCYHANVVAIVVIVTMLLGAFLQV